MPKTSALASRGEALMQIHIIIMLCHHYKNTASYTTALKIIYEFFSLLRQLGGFLYHTVTCIMRTNEGTLLNR